MDMVVSTLLSLLANDNSIVAKPLLAAPTPAPAFNLTNVQEENGFSFKRTYL